MSGKSVRFEALVQQAGLEPPPPIDVSHRVARSIARRVQSSPRGPSDSGDRAMRWSAGLSMAAALAVLLMASYQNVLSEEPLVAWLQSLVLVMS